MNAAGVGSLENFLNIYINLQNCKFLWLVVDTRYDEDWLTAINRDIRYYRQ